MRAIATIFVDEKKGWLKEKQPQSTFVSTSPCALAGFPNAFCSKKKGGYNNGSLILCMFLRSQEVEGRNLYGKCCGFPSGASKRLPRDAVLRMYWKLLLFFCHQLQPIHQVCDLGPLFKTTSPCTLAFPRIASFSCSKPIAPTCVNHRLAMRRL